ncbi:MAG: UDP-N-acetylmuramyl-tripeptide synthetase [Planctomycetales bacterium]|nr:UDP-N-acetylmuramyl-tripeptide synthetase [Planctomycetales bacterium]
MLRSKPSSAGVSLDKLFPSDTRTGSGEVVATSCSTDWRQVEPGDVFVALPDGDEEGLAGVGHEHAQRAVSHGAIAVICEQPVPVFDVPTYLVPDSRFALGRLCQALVGFPTHSMPTVGITGTHGKSITLALLDSIFSLAGKHGGVLSSLGCYDGMSHSGGMGEGPSSQALASRLAKMDAAGCTHALMEVSSRSLCQGRLAGIEFDVICITNVTDAHLDLHNSVQNYRNAKRRMFEYLSPTGVTVLNADDPVCLSWLDQIRGPVLTYGLGNQAEITAKILESHANGQVFLLSAHEESTAVRTSMVGEHHVSNCLAAAAISMSYGVDLQTIAAGIEAVDRLPGRMERIDCGQGFPVYVDAANTPESLRASLRAARQLARGRVICVLGDTSRGSASCELAIGSVVRRMSDLAIVSRPLPQVEDSNGVGGARLAHVEVIADRSEAIAWAVSMADTGDVVVITGSQPTAQQSFGASQLDAEMTRQMLYARNEVAVRLAA